MLHQRGLKTVLSSCCSNATQRVISRFDSSGPRISLSNVHQTISGRPRFYKLVDVVPVVDANGLPTESFKILLDGRNLRTPAGNNLYLPNIGLALSIAAEWDAQKAGNSKGIQPATMPMMTLAATAIDQILPDGYQVKKTCLSYLPTDTALFFTAEADRILLRKQRQNFQPILRWYKKAFDLDLQTTHDMSGRLVHPDEQARKIEWIVDHLDHFSLACLQCMTMECKSLVLAIAYLSRHLSFEQVKAASRLEEEFQVEVWGVVEGGHDMDRLNNSVTLSASGTFMGLLWDSKKLEKMLEQWKEEAPAGSLKYNSYFGDVKM